MKFVPRDLGDAAEASNPGSEGLRREIVVLLVAAVALILASYFAVGGLVEMVLPRISVARERAWFSHAKFPQKSVEPADADESARLERAQTMLVRLAADPRVPALDYRLVLIADTTPNAMAVPGGTILVTRGLLNLLDEEIPVAFVLGHELGHFAQRDHLRGIGRAFGRALVWGLVFGQGENVLHAHAGSLLDLAHSRKQEEGADDFGLELVRATYARTDGAEQLFVWLEERDQTPSWAHWLQTHPYPGKRVERLRARAAQLQSAAP
jgi:Putative Zn-dependent protease, contains TPR repeats